MNENKCRSIRERAENDYNGNTYKTDTYLPFIEMNGLAVRRMRSRVTLGYVPWLCHILSDYDLSNCLRIKLLPGPRFPHLYNSVVNTTYKIMKLKVAVPSTEKISK